MMFLFAVPVMAGDRALPRAADGRHAQHRLPAAERLRLLGLPVRRPAALRRASSLNIGPDAGWFSYVPLAGPEYSPGKRVDVWAQMITFTEISGLVAAVEHHHHGLQAARARHVAQPHAAVRLGDAGHAVHDHVRDAGGDARSTHAVLDRLVGTHFFNPAEGGDAAALAAPVLVLRPPRGLHHLHPGARASSRRSSRPSRAGRSSATRRWCCR